MISGIPTSFAIITDSTSPTEKYAECGPTTNLLNQRRHPPNPTKPSALRFLLLEISKHFGEDDVENFKALLEDYGQEDDKGALTLEQLQKVSTAFGLLMAAAKAGVIKPDDLSILVDFLTVSGYIALVQKIEDFQKKNQGE